MELIRNHPIPDDLWPEILPLLPTMSLLRSRFVCRSWRSFIDLHHPSLSRFLLLWSQILSRLPVKSLTRLRSVCGSWLSLIDDPDFARFQLHNHRESTSVLVDFLGIPSTSAPKFGLPNTPPIRGGIWAVICSIDGLYILTLYTDCTRTPELILWNPYLRKTLILPRPSEICAPTPYWDFGIGFDPSIRDYKFVRFLFRDKAVSLIAVYTPRTHSWKTITENGCSRLRLLYHFNSLPKGPTTLCFKGVLYGIAQDADSHHLVLVSFDLRSEILCSTKLPQVNEAGFFQALTLLDAGASMGLVLSSNSRVCVWVFGGDLKSPTLTHRYSFFPRRLSPSRLTFLMQYSSLEDNGDMVFKCGDSVMSYNVDDDDEMVLPIPRRPLFMTWLYKKSLIWF